MDGYYHANKINNTNHQHMLNPIITGSIQKLKTRQFIISVLINLLEFSFLNHFYAFWGHCENNLFEAIKSL